MTDRDISAYPEDAQAYIKELREEAKNRRLEVSDLNTKLQERDAVVGQANTKLDELNARIAQAQEITTKFSALQDEHAQTAAAYANTQLELARINAAREAKLDLSFADRLKGDSPDALKADAEAFKQSLGNGGVGPATGDRTNGNGAAAPMTEHDGLTSAIARHFAEIEGE
jgi:predicted nuclease with TOPRIM domain